MAGKAGAGGAGAAASRGGGRAGGGRNGGGGGGSNPAGGGHPALFSLAAYVPRPDWGAFMASLEPAVTWLNMGDVCRKHLYAMCTLTGCQRVHLARGSAAHQRLTRVLKASTPTHLGLIMF